MSTCGYHSPRFSEDSAWLPQWLQPHRQPMVGEHRRDSAGVSSPPCENCVFLPDPAQEQLNCQNTPVNAGGYGGFCLHLSGSEDTPAASTPTSREVGLSDAAPCLGHIDCLCKSQQKLTIAWVIENLWDQINQEMVLPFSLHLSSESAAQLSFVQANVSPQILNSDASKGLLKGSYVDGQAQETKAVQEAKGLKDRKPPEVCRVTRKDITKPLGARKLQPSGGKVDVQKLRNADANDAVELSIAASEAMVIAEMLLNDCQPDKLTAATLEAALHVKEARKQCLFQETEHDCGSFQNDLDESDWLAELEDVEMLDAFRDVGLSTVQAACSSQGHNTTDLKESISQPSCAPRDLEADNLDICSSEEQKRRWHSQDASTNDHVPDSLENTNSAGTLLKESTPGCDSVKQPALDKAISCSRNKETAFQMFTQNNLATLVGGQHIIKEGGRTAEEKKVGGATRKHIRTSFISESMDSMYECSPAPRVISTEMVASSRASFPQDTEGFYGENQSAELGYEVVCSSLPLEDPLCSFVPCSISCNEVSTSQAPECKQRNEEREPMCSKESLKKDLDVEATPSSVPLDKASESNARRRRIYSSLRPFSMMEPMSNILGGSATHIDVNVAVCQKERGTPITLNKKIQRVQASNQFTENNAEAGSSKDFSLVQKKLYAQDDNGHHSKEQFIPSEGFPQSSTYFNVGKQNLKRKGPPLWNSELSARQTKTRRVKSRFSWSDSRIADMREPKECIFKKENIFHGLEFLLTGFQSHKEKEVESIIRKSGGCVLSKVPPCPFDKKTKLTELVRCKPPIVLSPKKVSTAKFLYGCATDCWILNPSWLFDSLQDGVLLPPGKYFIRQSHTVDESSRFGQSLHLRNNKLVFRGVGFLIHGKISFCSKFSNIIKHGGGQVFVSLQGLIQSLNGRSSSHGIILVANEASASRHLSHCGLEHDIKTAPASWIIGSLFSGKLIPLKKDRCASFRRIKMPSFQQQHVFDMSQEI